MKYLFLVSRYSIIGGFAAVLDIGILYLLVDILHLYYLISASISFSVATLIAFILQKKFTFQDESSEIKRQMTSFFLITGTGLLMYVGLIGLFVSVMHIWYLMAAILAKGICFIWNFTLNYTITFKEAGY